MKKLDSGFRRNDENGQFQTSYEIIISKRLIFYPRFFILLRGRWNHHLLLCHPRCFPVNRASCKSRSLRHSGEPRIGSGAGAGLQNPGFRFTLRFPEMTIFYCLQEFCSSLNQFRLSCFASPGSRCPSRRQNASPLFPVSRPDESRIPHGA